MSLLENARNVFGPLRDDVRARIVRFLDRPSLVTWDQCYSIVIAVRETPEGRVPRTVWQAVCVLDPSYRGIALPDPGVRAATRWSRHPDALLVARAIRVATARRPFSSHTNSSPEVA